MSVRGTYIAETNTQAVLIPFNLYLFSSHPQSCPLTFYGSVRLSLNYDAENEALDICQKAFHEISSGWPPRSLSQVWESA